MNATGSGGLGAVSPGLSELLVWFLLAVAVLFAVLGVWKLIKLLLAAMSG